MSGDLVPDLRTLTALVCQGRALSADGTGSDGDVCGATLTYRRGVPGSLLDAARAAGWRVGTRVDGTPDAMCPRCAKPDPTTVALCRQLEKERSGG